MVLNTKRNAKNGIKKSQQFVQLRLPGREQHIQLDQIPIYHKILFFNSLSSLSNYSIALNCCTFKWGEPKVSHLTWGQKVYKIKQFSSLFCQTIKCKRNKDIQRVRACWQWLHGWHQSCIWRLNIVVYHIVAVAAICHCRCLQPSDQHSGWFFICLGDFRMHTALHHIPKGKH